MYHVTLSIIWPHSYLLGEAAHWFALISYSGHFFEAFDAQGTNLNNLDSLIPKPARVAFNDERISPKTSVICSITVIVFITLRKRTMVAAQIDTHIFVGSYFATFSSRTSTCKAQERRDSSAVSHSVLFEICLRPSSLRLENTDLSYQDVLFSLMGLRSGREEENDKQIKLLFQELFEDSGNE